MSLFYHCANECCCSLLSLGSSMIEMVFFIIYPFFELSKSFFDSSLGMITFQLYSSLDLAAGSSHSWSLTFSRPKNWAVTFGILFNKFLYAFPRPWVGLMHFKVLTHPLFGRICHVFALPLGKLIDVYISASREFTHLGLLALLWINLSKDYAY